jgi:hypothetical protein
VDVYIDSKGRSVVSFTRNRIITGARVWDQDKAYQGLHKFAAIDVCAGDSIQFNFTLNGVGLVKKYGR